MAGVFLIIAGVSWAAGNATKRNGFRQLLSSLDRWGAGVALCATVPIVATTLLFPEGGRFPISWTEAVATILTCVVVGVVTNHRTVRLGATIYAAATILVFLIPNPLGGNIVRLGMFVGAPLLACTLWSQRRTLLILFVTLLAIWQWRPAAAAILSSGADPSAHAAYFQPLLDRLATTTSTRIEIPFTQAHWETDFVASHIALARGWERQLDHKYDQLLYEPMLSAADYRAWLIDNAVQFVALPNVPLDFSSQREAALLRAGIPGLREVWHTPTWRLWTVTGTRPLVDGPARLTGISANSFNLDVTRPGTVTVRVHYSQRWAVDGSGCVQTTSQGWTEIIATSAGPIRLHQRLGPQGKSACAHPGDSTNPEPTARGSVT